MVLSPSWHISWYCFCTWSSRFSCKIINYSLDPSYLLWWSALIWCVFLFSHSSKTILFSQASFFSFRAHHRHTIFLSKSTITLTVPPKLTAKFGFIPRWKNKSLTEKNVFRTINWLGITHRSMATPCIPSIIKYNHNREWYLVHWLLPVIWERTVTASWIFGIKAITIFIKKYMVKIWVEALTSYYTSVTFLHLFLLCSFLVKL